MIEESQILTAPPSVGGPTGDSTEEDLSRRRASLPENCRQCGTVLTEDARFCAQCGAATGLAAPAPSARAIPGRDRYTPAKVGIATAVIVGVLCAIFYGYVQPSRVNVRNDRWLDVPIYPHATAVTEMTQGSAIRVATFLSDDSPETIGAWYRQAWLAAGLVVAPDSANSWILGQSVELYQYQRHFYAFTLSQAGGRTTIGLLRVDPSSVR